MPVIEHYAAVDILVRCSKCRIDLDVDITEKRGVYVIAVDPCPECLDAEYHEGYHDGAKEAGDA